MTLPICLPVNSFPPETPTSPGFGHCSVPRKLNRFPHLRTEDLLGCCAARHYASTYVGDSPAP